MRYILFSSQFYLFIISVLLFFIYQLAYIFFKVTPDTDAPGDEFYRFNPLSQPLAYCSCHQLSACMHRRNELQTGNRLQGQAASSEVALDQLACHAERRLQAFRFRYAACLAQA